MFKENVTLVQPYFLCWFTNVRRGAKTQIKAAATTTIFIGNFVRDVSQV